MNRLKKFLIKEINNIVESEYNFDSDIIFMDEKLSLIKNALGEGFESNDTVVFYHLDSPIDFNKEELINHVKLYGITCEISDNKIILWVHTEDLELDYDAVIEAIASNIFRDFFMHNQMTTYEPIDLFILFEMMEIEKIWEEILENKLEGYLHSGYDFLITNFTRGNEYLVIDETDYKGLGNYIREIVDEN